MIEKIEKEAKLQKILIIAKAAIDIKTAKI